MNVSETAEILTLMKSAWPAADVKPATAAVWAEMLVGVDPRDGLEAAKSLMLSLKWFPSLAEFVEATRSARRIRTGDAEGQEPMPRAELDEVPLSRDQALENVAKIRASIRQTLAAQKGYEHKHGALGPCQVPNCPSVIQPKAVEYETF